MTDSEIIAYYGLTPHPEGGFYRRTYASSVLTEYGGSKRPVCTAILFLLKAGQYSRLHCIPQDEMWHFYLGGPLRLVLITPDRASFEIVLGQNVSAGHRLQYSVPGGSWFGATPAQGSSYSLVGCTVAPGFCMDELKLGEAHDLLDMFPSASHIITEFCPTFTGKDALDGR
ncbi:MAG: cupin domain-containing protein [Desulfovibrio sp.]|nr:cupin domain-containing protein [Desulfovibrio sp.]